jgi:hypothetical protein
MVLVMDGKVVRHCGIVGVERGVQDGVSVADDEQAVHAEMLIGDLIEHGGERLRIDALGFGRGSAPFAARPIGGVLCGQCGGKN